MNENVSLTNGLSFCRIGFVVAILSKKSKEKMNPASLASMILSAFFFAVVSAFIGRFLFDHVANKKPLRQFGDGSLQNEKRDLILLSIYLPLVVAYAFGGPILCAYGNSGVLFDNTADHVALIVGAVWFLSLLVSLWGADVVAKRHGMPSLFIQKWNGASELTYLAVGVTFFCHPFFAALFVSALSHL
jgi:hypothetical protein